MNETDNVTPLRPGPECRAGDPDERLPDPGLQQFCIEWIRKIQNPNADQAELLRLGNAILDTPATSKRSVAYKIAAAAATAELYLVENHAVTLILRSAIDDDNRLAGRG